MQKFPLLNTDFLNRRSTLWRICKTHPELIKFIVNFQQQHHIPLDFVYTGKLFYKLFNLIEIGYFPQSNHHCHYTYHGSNEC